MIEQEIKDIAKDVYKKSRIFENKINVFGTEVKITSKWGQISLVWDSHYAKLKNMFTKKLDSLILPLPYDKYELLWKDTISHSFLKLDQDNNPIILRASMFLGDESILGIFDPNSPNNILQPSPEETFNVPLIVYYNKETGKNILVKSTDIRYITGEYSIGYCTNPLSDEVVDDVILNTKEGFMLEGRIGFDDNGRLIDRGNNWFEFYLDKDKYFSEQNGVYTLKNCYRYIMFITGENVMPFLQRVVHNFVETLAYEPYFASETSKTYSIIDQDQESYRVSFLDHKFIDDRKIRNFVGEVTSIIEQFSDTYVPSHHSIFNYESISDLIISKEFFEENGIDIESMWNDLNPTVDQLAILSTKLIGVSRQKQFYNTLHEILKGYSGSNKLINDYNKIQGYLKFGDIYTSKYTESEFKAVTHLEEILPEILSYRFYTFMKSGMINLYKEQGAVKFQPIVFDMSLLVQIMNQRRMKAISTNNLLPYKQRSFSTFIDRTLCASILFCHLTEFTVISKGRRVIYTKAPVDILSNLAVGGSYRHHNNPLRYSNHYGADVRVFLANYYYTGGVNQDLRIKRNIIGKTAIMKGFSDFLQDAMSPTIINLAGRQLSIDEYRDHPQVWSEKNINFAFNQIFEKLINPVTRDPTLDLIHVYTGNKQAKLYQITNNKIQGATSSF
ncbi:MAG: hypothetical protein ACTSV5_05800 [Promethearchaeota archaeon]